MAVGVIVILGGALAALLLTAWILNVLTDRKWPGVILVGAVTLIISTYVSSIVGVLWFSPAPTPVDDRTEDDGNRAILFVERVRIDFPDDSHAEFSLALVNDSTYEIKTETSYYADGGKVGSYSPGASGRDWVASITPEWKGTLTYRSWVPKFAPGGWIKVTVSSFEDVEELDLEERQILFSKQYEVVPAEIKNST